MKKTFFYATALACLLSACESKTVEQVQLIPQAKNVEILNGSFALSNLKSIQTPEGWKVTAENFINDVQKSTGLSVVLATEGASVTLVDNWKQVISQVSVMHSLVFINSSLPLRMVNYRYLMCKTNPFMAIVV